MEIRENIPLAPLTTFKIGGTARYFCTVTSAGDLSEAARFAGEHKLPIFILGGGSNVLISDEGFKGLVLYISIGGIEWNEEGDEISVAVGAGVVWDDFVAQAVSRGYWGIENLSHVPGRVGASAIQNIGCYGVEAGERIEWVEEFMIGERVTKRLPHDECRFAYRESVWKHSAPGSRVVTRVGFRLSKHGKPNIGYKDLKDYFAQKSITNPTLLDIRSALREIRSAKFPDLARYGTAGSFFKNPIISKEEAQTLTARYPDAPTFTLGDGRIKLSAPWILDHLLHLRGARRGGVGTWETHALVVVNYGDASAKEVHAFTGDVVDRMRALTAITLEPEVVFVGE